MIIPENESFETPIYVEKRYNNVNTSKSREYHKSICRLNNLEVYCLSLTSDSIGLTYHKLDYFNDSDYWNCKEIMEEEFDEHVEDYFKGLMK